MSLAYANAGWGLPCPVRGLTGWLCPFCGGTHMGAALLHGDLAAAWNANSALLVAFFLLGARTIGWVVELLRGVPRHLLPVKVRTYIWPAVLVCAVVWMVVRNLT